MKIKICYIGGGSRMWAKTFMNDLALQKDLEGEIFLYDIDLEAAKVNEIIGNKISAIENSAKWEYHATKDIKEAMVNANLVVISILPGTFKEMRSDVHTPEKYGIYQSVGDTVGPGGIIRAMRTIPIYFEFAKYIKEYASNAWVINLTNPMSICVRALYDSYPEIKAFGCCHEVFNAQEFLACVVSEELKLPKPSRKEIEIDASGINHFTFISKATFHDVNIFKLLETFMEKYYETGYFERGPIDKFKYDPFAYGNKVKMHLFKEYGVLGGAGDRHLVEFMNNNWYLKDRDTIKSWLFNLTTVDYRIKDRMEKVQKSHNEAYGDALITLNKSSEEIVDFIRAIFGFKVIKSNVNLPNKGQVIGLSNDIIVETNATFKENSVEPIIALPLPTSVLNLVSREALNIEEVYQGIKHKDLKRIYNAFKNDPLLSNLGLEESKALFKEMIFNTKDYLEDYYNLEEYFE